MLWLYIVLIVVLIFLLVIFAPVNLKIKYEKYVWVEIKFLFLKFKFNNSEVKKPKVKKKNAKPKSNFVQNIIKERGIIGALKFVCDVIRLSRGVLRNIFEKTHIKNFQLNVRVASKDAAETAILYGKSCAALYPLEAFLSNFNKADRFDFSIAPDFLKTKTEFTLNLEAKTRIFSMCYVLFKFFKEYRKII